MRDVVIIAHRGASSEKPENTISAFQRAIDLDADMIELDIHETLDQELVCIHDYDVTRTTDGIGLISEMTYEQLTSLNAGDGECIPLLSDVLDLCRDKIDVNIELKIMDIEKELLELVEKKDMLDNVLFSSFYHETLIILKESCPNCKTAILYESPISNVVSYASSMQASAINPLHSLISSDLVEDAHSSQLSVYPWTVNDCDTAHRMLEYKIDGVISDNPALMINTCFK